MTLAFTLASRLGLAAEDPPPAAEHDAPRTDDAAMLHGDEEAPPMADEASATAPESGTYTIDELAAHTKVPSRTIRFYQSKGALQKPHIKGRVAFYDDTHARRLELIAQLQDRGLRIDAIRDLVVRIDRGEVDLNAWLGLDRELSTPWAQDAPRLLSEAELSEVLGGERRPGFIGELLRLGLAERRGDSYLVHSTNLLSLSARAAAAGVDLDTVRRAADVLRRNMGKAASELAELFYRQAKHEIGDGPLQAQLDALRPLALEAVRTLFAQEMERVLRGFIESGRTTTLTQKRRR